MSPRFYWSLWVAFFVSAGVLWLGGVFTLTTLIIYGFLGFGLVFTGMMCVLPNVVSHPPVKPARQPVRREALESARAGTPIGSPISSHV